MLEFVDKNEKPQVCLLIEKIAADVAPIYGWSEHKHKIVLRAALALLQSGKYRAVGAAARSLDLHDAVNGLVRAAVVAHQSPGYFTSFNDPDGQQVLNQMSYAEDFIWTVDELRRRLTHYDNHNRYMPYATWWNEGALSIDMLRGTLLDIWMMTPTRRVPQWLWLEMFKAAGYLSSPAGIDPPSMPLTLWRGSTARGWRRLSWTSDRTVGAWFAWRIPHTGAVEAGVLFEVTVAPRHVLAVANDRGESEYVVNPASLCTSRNVRRVRVFSQDDESPRHR